MITKQAIERLKNFKAREKRRALPDDFNVYVEHQYNIDALDMAIEALSKQCASSEQAAKDIKFPTIHCCRGDKSGRMGFGVYDPKEKNIYIAGDVPKEIFLKALFHEVFHWVQDVAGMKFNEDDANSFSDILYDAVDMFDDHGPGLFGQKTIVEPGEVFVGENVLKKALDHQFRDSTKKTEDVPDIRVGKTDFKPGDKFILELGQERRMFGEFEIKGTDLYVKTDLLEKLTRYEPEIIRCKDCKYSVDEYSEGDCYCRRPKKGIDYIGNWNFYCADAERQNDG